MVIEHSPYHCTALIPSSIKTEIQLIVDQHFRVKIKDIFTNKIPVRISLTRRPVSSSRGSISYNGRGYYHHNSKPPRDPDYLKTVISPDGSLETWHNVWRHMSQHRNGFQDDSIKEKIGLKMRRSMQCYEYCHVMIRFNKHSFSYILRTVDAVHP